jgi:hypothetical protein
MEGFRMLQWNCSFDGPWSGAAESKYWEGNFDGPKPD